MKNLPIEMRCSVCGMPLIEGPLLTRGGPEVWCQNCLPKEGARCDFCGEPEPHHFYVADVAEVILVATEEVTFTECGDTWTACDSCKVIVDADEAHNLVDRIIACRGRGHAMMEFPEAKDILLTYFTVVLGMIRRPSRELNPTWK